MSAIAIRSTNLGEMALIFVTCLGACLLLSYFVSFVLAEIKYKRQKASYMRVAQYHALEINPSLLRTQDRYGYYHMHVVVRCKECGLSGPLCELELAGESWKSLAAGPLVRVVLPDRSLLVAPVECTNGTPGVFVPPDLSAIQGTPFASVPLE